MAKLVAFWVALEAVLLILLVAAIFGACSATALVLSGGWLVHGLAVGFILLVLPAAFRRSGA